MARTTAQSTHATQQPAAALQPHNILENLSAGWAADCGRALPTSPSLASSQAAPQDIPVTNSMLDNKTAAGSAAAVHLKLQNELTKIHAFCAGTVANELEHSRTTGMTSEGQNNRHDKPGSW
jgi:hypothetical protein